MTMISKSKPNHTNGSVSEEQRAKKAHQVRSNVKVLLTVLFGYNSAVHHEFLHQYRSVNKKYYLEVKHRLREATHQKRTELWKVES